MKKKLLVLVCLSSLFICGGCSCGNSNSLNDMGLIELNDYADNVKDDLDYAKDRYNDVYDRVEGKTQEEIIELINTVNNEVVRSDVTVINSYKMIDDYGRIFPATSLGSGSIIKETTNKYYVLTNNHVIATEGVVVSTPSYEVHDYLNNAYKATLEYTRKDYDMAILSFTKVNSNLRVATIAKEDAKIKDNIISVGQPLGKRNTISFGEVTNYDYVFCKGSEVAYKCMFYDAFTNEGNSGGMVINYNFEIVGITTFGIMKNGRYEAGAGSSASKIREFINLFETEGGGFNA